MREAICTPQKSVKEVMIVAKYLEEGGVEGRGRREVENEEVVKGRKEKW